MKKKQVNTQASSTRAGKARVAKFATGLLTVINQLEAEQRSRHTAAKRRQRRSSK